jgi:hypothetical protein
MATATPSERVDVDLANHGCREAEAKRMHERDVVVFHVFNLPEVLAEVKGFLEELALAASPGW